MGEAHEPESPRSVWLHPRIYAAMGVLAGVFALAAWGFAGGGYTRMEVAVVSIFVSVVIVLMSAIAHIRRRRANLLPADEAGAARSFRNWAGSQFETSGGLVKARLAAIEALLHRRRRRSGGPRTRQPSSPEPGPYCRSFYRRRRSCASVTIISIGMSKACG